VLLLRAYALGGGTYTGIEALQRHTEEDLEKYVEGPAGWACRWWCCPIRARV
jgi:hypothetical protein